MAIPLTPVVIQNMIVYNLILSFFTILNYKIWKIWYFVIFNPLLSSRLKYIYITVFSTSKWVIIAVQIDFFTSIFLWFVILGTSTGNVKSLNGKISFVYDWSFFPEKVADLS